MHSLYAGRGAGQHAATKFRGRPIVPTSVHPALVVKRAPPIDGVIGLGQGVKHLVPQTVRF